MNEVPDFSDMDELVLASTMARLRADQIKSELSVKVGECVRKAYRDKSNWINGRPPTQIYIDKVISVVGNTDEDAEALNAMRLEYSELMQKYQEAKLLLDNMKNQISVFQTKSANKRKSVL